MPLLQGALKNLSKTGSPTRTKGDGNVSLLHLEESISQLDRELANKICENVWTKDLCE